MPQLRFPGWPTLAILAVLIALAALMHLTKAAEATTFTATVLSLVVGTLVAKSALTTKPKTSSKVAELPPPHPRARANTWPGRDDDEGGAA